MRFVWRLQRILDIKGREEEALRGELFEITQKALSVRQLIVVKQSEIRSTMAELRAKPDTERVREQGFVLRCIENDDEQIRRLSVRLEQIEEERKAKMFEIMKVRKFRKGLEKLRENAKTEFVQEQNMIEQKLLDDSTNISEARKVLAGYR
jgi:flagellar protein FliJ